MRNADGRFPKERVSRWMSARGLRSSQNMLSVCVLRETHRDSGSWSFRWEGLGINTCLPRRVLLFLTTLLFRYRITSSLAFSTWLFSLSLKFSSSPASWLAVLSARHKTLVGACTWSEPWGTFSMPVSESPTITIRCCSSLPENNTLYNECSEERDDWRSSACFADCDVWV